MLRRLQELEPARRYWIGPIPRPLLVGGLRRDGCCLPSTGECYLHAPGGKRICNSPSRFCLQVGRVRFPSRCLGLAGQGRPDRTTYRYLSISFRHGGPAQPSSPSKLRGPEIVCGGQGEQDHLADHFCGPGESFKSSSCAWRQVRV
jgi:hypothetical protein